jgi:hypothetical protein
MSVFVWQIYWVAPWTASIVGAAIYGWVYYKNTYQYDIRLREEEIKWHDREAAAVAHAVEVAAQLAVNGSTSGKPVTATTAAAVIHGQGCDGGSAMLSNGGASASGTGVAVGTTKTMGVGNGASSIASTRTRTPSPESQAMSELQGPGDRNDVGRLSYRVPVPTQQRASV